MELIVIVIAVFGLVTCSIFFLVSPRRETESEVLERRLSGMSRGGLRQGNAPGNTFWEQTAVFFLGNKELAPQFSKLRRVLYQAGYPYERAVTVFWGVRIFLMLVLTSLITAWGILNQKETLDVVLLACLGLLLGYVGPLLQIRIRANKRIREIRETLPDTLDLLVVCSQAGMGLDSAFVRVGKEQAASKLAVGDELQLMSREIRAGLSRREAMGRLAERLDIEEIGSLVAFINQSEEHGGSITRTLTIYANTMRDKRTQRAEEAARKAVIKLLLPMAFLIMPSLFLVILALPASELSEFFGNF